jgi:hypothetical protein
VNCLQVQHNSVSIIGHWNKRISILISLLSIIVHFDVEPEWLGDEANDNDHNNGKEEVMDVHDSPFMDSCWLLVLPLYHPLQVQWCVYFWIIS